MNGTCDAVTVITDSTTGGTPLTYTITGSCTGYPTSSTYSGEWYQGTGNWKPGTQVCNSNQTNTPCFVDIYGDHVYHQAGGFLEQADEEQQYPLQTMPFTGSAWNGTIISAYSDTGTDRMPDNLELGYNVTTNPDPVGDDVSCTTSTLANLLPYPYPVTPAVGESACGEKDGQFDGWNGNLLNLINLGLTSLDISTLFKGTVTCSYPSCLLPVGSLLGGQPFMPKYHFWPNDTIYSGMIDAPLPVPITLPGPVISGLLGSLGMSVSLQDNVTLGIALPNDAYIFLPNPSFGGLLTVGQCNWNPTYGYGSSCSSVSYSPLKMTNAQINQYVNLVNILMGVLNGTIKLAI